MNKVAVAALILGAAVVSARAQGTTDAPLAKGVAQIQGGYLEDGVATLADAGRRISAAANRRDALALVYLWLGIAQAQLDSPGAARFSFREAMRLDRSLRLPEGMPPKVVRLFASVKEDGTDQDAEQLARTEGSLREAARSRPRDAAACGKLAAFLYQSGRASFEETVASWERCLRLAPPEATAHLLFAGGYWDRAYHDATFDDVRKERYADTGLAQVDKAMALKPDSLDALVFKGLFLRIKASVAPDAAKRSAYAAEATHLETQALALAARLPAEAGLFVKLAVEEGVPGRVVKEEPPPPPPAAPRPQR